jgi:chemotaxis-related protein WspD
MIALPVQVPPAQCWHKIGVWGDRTCPELAAVTHCHNCPVFAAAGRKFLDAPPPRDYADEWTARLAAPEQEEAGDVLSVLVFRMVDEWLAFPVAVMVEVTRPRASHRVPHRGGLLAGLVNIRGELHMCARLDRLLGLTPPEHPPADASPRLLVVRVAAEGWVFPVDQVDRVRRVAIATVTPTPPTLGRAAARLTRGVFARDGRSIGLLDEVRVFQALRERVR